MDTRSSISPGVLLTAFIVMALAAKSAVAGGITSRIVRSLFALFESTKRGGSHETEGERRANTQVVA